MSRRKTSKKFGQPKLRDSHTTRVAEGRIEHKSKGKSPVKRCWEIFDKLREELGEEMTRKYAIDYAEKKCGIAFYTARTQYQEWKKAGDNDRRTRELQRQKFGTAGVANLSKIGVHL